MYKKKYFKYLAKAGALCYPFHKYPRISENYVPECTENTFFGEQNKIKSNNFSEFYTDQKIQNLEKIILYLKTIPEKIRGMQCLFHMSIGNPVIESFNYKTNKNTVLNELYLILHSYHVFPNHVRQALQNNVKTFIINISPQKNNYINFTIEDMVRINSIPEIKTLEKINTDFGDYYILNGIHELFVVDTMMPSYYITKNEEHIYFTEDDKRITIDFYSNLKLTCEFINATQGLVSIFSFAIFANLQHLDGFTLFPKILDLSNIALLGEWKRNNFVQKHPYEKNIIINKTSKKYFFNNLHKNILLIPLIKSYMDNENSQLLLSIYENNSRLNEIMSLINNDIMFSNQQPEQFDNIGILLGFLYKDRKIYFNVKLNSVFYEDNKNDNVNNYIIKL